MCRRGCVGSAVRRRRARHGGRGGAGPARARCVGLPLHFPASLSAGRDADPYVQQLRRPSTSSRRSRPRPTARSSPERANPPARPAAPRPLPPRPPLPRRRPTQPLPRHHRHNHRARARPPRAGPPFSLRRAAPGPAGSTRCAPCPPSARSVRRTHACSRMCACRRRCCASAGEEASSWTRGRRPSLGSRTSKGASVRRSSPSPCLLFGVELAADSDFVLTDIPFAQLLKNPALALDALAAASSSSAASCSPARPSSPLPLDAPSATSDDVAALSLDSQPPADFPAPPRRITLLCRRGNDSLLAARALRRHLATRGTAGEQARKGDSAEREGREGVRAGAEPIEIEVEDVRGGLAAWAVEEPGFPVY